MSETTADPIELHPAWRQALAGFHEQGFEAGDLVDFDWLYGAFKITRPGPATCYEDAKKADFAFVAAMEPFRAALLREHQIALANVRGLGYRIVPPPEQTEWAETTGLREAKRALGKMGHRLSFVDMRQLNAAQRRANADALTRYAMLVGLTKRIEKVRREPEPAVRADEAPIAIGGPDDA